MIGDKSFGKKGFILHSSKDQNITVPGFLLSLYARQSTEIKGNSCCAQTYKCTELLSDLGSLIADIV